jgi:hypothetical protein
MNKRNTIYNVASLEKRKYINAKKEKVSDVLAVIRENKRKEEQEKIANLRRPPLPQQPLKTQELQAITILKRPVYQTPVQTKTINKPSYVDKLMENSIARKKERQEKEKRELYGEWPEPTMKQIMRGERSLLDYPDMALLDELSHINNGWAMFMEFTENRANNAYISIIKGCIESARRKRPWILTKEEILEIQKKKEEDERRHAEELQQQKIAEQEREANERKLMEAAEMEQRRLQQAIEDNINRMMNEILSDPDYMEFERRLHIPGSWAAYIDYLEGNLPSQKYPTYVNTIKYYIDSDSEYDSDLDTSELDINYDSDSSSCISFETARDY